MSRRGVGYAGLSVAWAGLVLAGLGMAEDLDRNVALGLLMALTGSLLAGWGGRQRNRVAVRRATAAGTVEVYAGSDMAVARKIFERECAMWRRSGTVHVEGLKASCVSPQHKLLAVVVIVFRGAER